MANQPDGTVRARFEGGSTAVGELVAWVHEGPPHAHVERVDVDDVPVEGWSGFEVR